MLSLHAELIRIFGGNDGIRDESLLDAALAAPFQSYESRDLFPTVREKAARLGFGIVRNHPFVDGNKRTGAHSMLVILVLNGLELAYSQDSLSDIFIEVAAGTAENCHLLDWVARHQIRDA